MNMMIDFEIIRRNGFYIASKPKNKTYIVHHRGQAQHGGHTVLG